MTARLPLSREDEQRIANSRMRAANRVLGVEVEALRAIRDAAHYVVGPAVCAGDEPDCEEYFDAEGNPLSGMRPAGVEWCSHVEHRYATWNDVAIRGLLEGLITEILGLVNKPTSDVATDVREVIHDTLSDIVAGGFEGDIKVDSTQEPYKTAVAEEYVAAVLGMIESTGSAE